MVRILIACIALFASIPLSAAESSEAKDIMTVIQLWIESLNQGEMDRFASAHTPSPSITDAVPPYVFQGPTALAEWAAAVDAEAKKGQITNGKASLLEGSHVEVADRSAYVVVPSVYSYEMLGQKHADQGSVTFAMQKVGADWKIAAWTWTVK